MTGLLVAVTGLCGSGKTEAANHLRKLAGAEVVYIGGLVLEEVKKRGLELNAINERTVQMEVRNECGAAAFAVLAEPTIRQHLSNGKPVVIDAVYVWEELKYFQECLPSTRTTLVSIYSSFDARCARLASRPVRPFSRHDVLTRDKSDVMRLGTGIPLALGDHQVANDGSLADYHGKLTAVWSQVSSVYAERDGP